MRQANPKLPKFAHPGYSTFSLVFKCSPSTILNALRHVAAAKSDVTMCVVLHQRIVLNIMTATQEEALCV
jgi:hypothetical protein